MCDCEPRDYCYFKKKSELWIECRCTNCSPNWPWIASLIIVLRRHSSLCATQYLITLSLQVKENNKSTNYLQWVKLGLKTKIFWVTTTLLSSTTTSCNLPPTHLLYVKHEISIPEIWDVCASKWRSQSGLNPQKSNCKLNKLSQAPRSIEMFPCIQYYASLFHFAVCKLCEYWRHRLGRTANNLHIYYLFWLIYLHTPFSPSNGHLKWSSLIESWKAGLFIMEKFVSDHLWNSSTVFRDKLCLLTNYRKIIDSQFY